MRRRKKNKTVKEFSKKLIKYVVAFTSICMVVCLVGMFMDKDVTTMFCTLCGVLGGEIVTYCTKAYFGKKNEEENKLKTATELYLLDNEEGEEP